MRPLCGMPTHPCPVTGAPVAGFRPCGPSPAPSTVHLSAPLSARFHPPGSLEVRCAVLSPFQWFTGIKHDFAPIVHSKYAQNFYTSQKYFVFIFVFHKILSAALCYSRIAFPVWPGAAASHQYPYFFRFATRKIAASTTAMASATTMDHQMPWMPSTRGSSCTAAT